MVSAQASLGPKAIIFTYDYGIEPGTSRCIFYWGGPVPLDCPSSAIDGDEEVLGASAPETYIDAVRRNRSHVHQAEINLTSSGGGSISGTITNVSGSSLTGSLFSVLYDPGDTLHHNAVKAAPTPVVLSIAPAETVNFNIVVTTTGGGTLYAVWFQLDSKEIVQAAGGTY